jgi:hypothetical protein
MGSRPPSSSHTHTMEEPQSNDDTQVWLDDAFLGDFDSSFLGIWDHSSQTFPEPSTNLQGCFPDELLLWTDPPAQEDINLAQQPAPLGFMALSSQAPTMPLQGFVAEQPSQDNSPQTPWAWDFSSTGTSQGSDAMGFSPGTISTMSPVSPSSPVDILAFPPLLMPLPPVTQFSQNLVNPFPMLTSGMASISPTPMGLTTEIPTFGDSINVTRHFGTEQSQSPPPTPQTYHQPRSYQHVTGQLKTQPKRYERRAKRPVECPACKKGHAYQAAVSRHILTNHPELAESLGVPKEIFVCSAPGCRREYTRSDRLYRHGRNKRGWAARKKPRS